MFCNINFFQSFPETLQITLILQENKQYGQTTQKQKSVKRSKTLKTKLCQNTVNHSNLAHKRPKRSNRTKNETRVNTSKTATKCWKPLRNDFCDQILNQNLFLEKTDFWSKSSKNAFNHQKFAQKRQNNTKTKNRSKTSKTVKAHWKHFGKSFHDQKAKQFYFRNIFFPNLYKTPETTWNLLKNEQFSKTATKLKVGEERWRLSNH